MLNFPEVDPIPLPAPVWLFKFLHILTLSLHFVAVQMLLGGLLVSIVLSLIVSFKSAPDKALKLTAATMLAKRLPIVMTFVINLGIPPLLFSQVLYGRALYTSSVLIGAYWIALIPVLILCYWLLYQFAQRLEAGKIHWWIGLFSWLLAGCIAKVFSTNMTLMLRPEVWPSMYQASASGLLLPPFDPTLMPRWVTMLSGGMMASGLWLIWLSPSKNLAEETKQYLHKLGGILAAFFAIVYGTAGLIVFKNQESNVKAELWHNPVFRYVGLLWLVLVIVILLVGTAAYTGKLKASCLGRWLAGISGLLATSALVIFRDGIRDVTLSFSGYNVWDRAVVTNWSVVVIFLALFVVGLVVIGWLISVIVRAQPVKEEVTV